MTYEEEFEGEWQKTDTSHVWYCPSRNVYTFEDEANIFWGIYHSQADAENALRSYCEHFLGVVYD